jgi:DNA polymerase III epsilon subunit-like protein
MILQLQNLNKYKNIILFDIEYDNSSLVQVALLILGAKEPHMFEVQKSLNVYIKQNHLLSPFFVKYTNISDAYLRDNGIDLSGARTLVESVIFDIKPEETLLVGHGIDNDMRLLDICKFPFSRFSNICDTYKRAKKLLKRTNNLTLSDLAAEDGYCSFNEHNAYADTWALLHAFCVINRWENNKNEIF